MDKEAEMNEEQAQMLSEVYLPAFMEKCAERGVEITSEDDLRGLLSISANVKMLKEGSKKSVIKEASASLLKATGMDRVEAEEQRREAVKTAAARFGQNGKVRDLLTKQITQALESKKE
jgi:hypothetical protein